jgi:hypothetical protein
MKATQEDHPRPAPTASPREGAGAGLVRLVHAP